MSELDRRLVAIAATRQMVSEAWDEELLTLLVESGAVNAAQAFNMLHRLRSRLFAHVDSAQPYALDPTELEAQSDRVAALALAYTDSRRTPEQ